MTYSPRFFSIMRQLYRFNFNLGFSYKIRGLGGLARYFEYPLAIESLPRLSGQSVLDVGSGATVFPFFLASQGMDVILLDINTEALQKTHGLAARLEGRVKGVVSVVSDATIMSFEEQSFDAVTCISMIEHPPGDGDAKTMEEIGRVLKVGGMAFVSFPYGQEFAINKQTSLTPWKKECGLHLIERRYDLASIASRLANPSGLQVVRQGYALGGRLNTLTAYLNSLGTKFGKLYRWSWCYIFLAHIIARWDEATPQNAEFAYLILRK